MKFHTNDPNRVKPYIDFSLILITLFLVAFGLIMVYSTSSYEASMSAVTKNDAAYYLKKQAAASVAGIILMIFVSYIPYHFWEKLSGIAYVTSAALTDTALKTTITARCTMAVHD